MKKKKREENYQLEMLEGAKLIGAGAATIASAGAAIGIGNVLSSSIHSVARNPSLAKQSFGYAILGFALTEAIASFAPMMAFLISSVFRSKNQRKKVWELSWSGKAKMAPRIWVARGRLCPDGGALWGRAQPNRDNTPPTSSTPLYRLNHSKGLIDRTGEPRELVRASKEGKWQGISKKKKEEKAKGIAKDFFPHSHQIGELNKLFYASGIGKHDKSVLHILASSLVFKERKLQRLTEEKGEGSAGESPIDPIFLIAPHSSRPGTKKSLRWVDANLDLSTEQFHSSHSLNPIFNESLRRV
ncbi:ATPase subunit 9 [Tanacetum coccineum]